MLPDLACTGEDYSCGPQSLLFVRLTPIRRPRRFHPRRLQGKDSTFEQEDELRSEKNETKTSENKGDEIMEMNERMVLVTMVDLDEERGRMVHDVR